MQSGRIRKGERERARREEEKEVWGERRGEN